MSKKTARLNAITHTLKTILVDLSGFELDELDPQATFLELGFDSLFLIQMCSAIGGELNIKLSFRQLIEDTDTFTALIHYIEQQLPEDALAVESAPEAPPTAAPAPPLNPQPVVLSPAHPPVQPSLPTAAPPPASPNFTPAPIEASSAIESILAQQIQLMSMQLQMLGGQPVAPPPAAVSEPAAAPPPPAAVPEAPPAAVAIAKVEEEEPKLKTSKEMQPFGAIARINTDAGDDLTDAQQRWLNDFIARYNERTKTSKAFAAEHQPHMSDPRVVSGFKRKTKELVYPLVTDHSQGARIWDADGNEYVDALNGFGSNFFGYANPYINQMVIEQLQRGAEIGPQTPLVGEVARDICKLTHMDRAAFCNTGSEAVMGAMRIARTVTGRKLIVIFSGSYHGIFDEVLVRGTKRLRSVPAAPGIMPSTVQNVLVLDYGTEESLQIIRERVNELAAVMVEPIQSRRPEFQPREFLQEVRQITAAADIPFIFDEVITGFRMGPQGAQGYYGIQADIATYGKVIGGGMSIGVVAGKRKYMDALDGGAWHYGDDSVPEVGVTYFAGTFVRHPAAIAACRAALDILIKEGAALQERVNRQTNYLVSELNNFFRDRQVPLEVNHFSSLWRMTYSETIPYGEVLFYLIRQNGVHIYDGFPCFITMAHSDEDVDLMLNAIKKSVIEFQGAGFLPPMQEEVAEADFFAVAS